MTKKIDDKTKRILASLNQVEGEPGEEAYLDMGRKMIANWGRHWAAEFAPETVEAARQQVALNAERQMLTGYTDDTSSSSTAQVPTFEEYVEVVKALRAVQRPLLQEIWFVDAMSEYVQFQDACEAPRTEAPGMLAQMQGYVQPSLSGIPVHIWLGQAELAMCVTPGEEQDYFTRSLHVPFYGLLPGIWLKLRDGRIQNVRSASDLISAFKASQPANNSG